MTTEPLLLVERLRMRGTARLALKKPSKIDREDATLDQCAADRIEALEAALKPFADACTITTKSDDEDIDDSLAATKITFGHIRRARAALEGKPE